MPHQSSNRSLSTEIPSAGEDESGVVPVLRVTAQSLVLESLSALFDAYAVAVLAADCVPEACPPAADRKLARIQFTNEDTEEQGTLLIGVPYRVALAMQPNDLQITYFDWVGELANQFLGRFKNNLLTCGVRLQMGTPELCADTAVPSEQIANDALWFRLQTGGGEVVAAARGLPKDSEFGAADTTGMLTEGEFEMF